ncbi:MAG: hypothetical protein M0014_15225 [Actinomycetota bacterium]|nr:hypothetical protein [Actinomycetota bacterium]
MHVGLVTFGFCLALLVRAHLGVDPCDVLHQGIARRVDVQPGRVVMAVGGLVWWCSIPLRQTAEAGHDLQRRAHQTEHQPRTGPPPRSAG